MIDKFKSLARGFIQSSKSTLYKPAANQRAIINSIFIYNQASDGITVSVWLYVKGSRIPLCPESFSLGSHYSIELVDIDLGLESNDYIEGRAGQNSQLLFNINGKEDVM